MSDIHGAVWWSELMTRDVKAALDYYKSVCGWTFEEMEMDSGIYYVGVRDGRPITGIMDMTPMQHLRNAPPHWFTYFAVGDVQAAVATTEKMGGTVLRAPFEVPRIGHIAIVTDPTGAMMGLMTPIAPAD